MIAIFAKELKTYFKSIFGWIFFAVFTFFSSVFFIISSVLNGSPYISDSLMNLVSIFILVLPLITMRIIAEERRQKTDQLLITSPIPMWKIILGKYLALCAIMFIATLVVALDIIVIAIYGTVPVSDTIIALLGFFLLACEMLAIGVFVSSITEHQILAAILSIFVNLFTLRVPEFIYNIFGDKLITKIFTVFYIYAPFGRACSGILDLVDVLYAISVIAIFIILAYKVFAKDSVQVDAVGRNKYFLSNLMPFAAILLIIGLNVGSHFIPDKYMEYDFTTDKIYSVTAKTKEVLKNNSDDITIFVFSSKDGVDDRVKYTLDSYQRASSKVKVVYKDDDYGKNQSSLTVKVKDQSQDIDYYDLYEWQTYGYQYYITGFNIEKSITQAIVALKGSDEYVDIPSKSIAYDNVVVSDGMLVFYVVIFCLVLPLVFVAMGIIVTVFRKKIAALFSRG